METKSKLLYVIPLTWLLSAIIIRGVIGRMYRSSLSDTALISIWQFYWMITGAVAFIIWMAILFNVFEIPTAKKVTSKH